jgi:hypothetical protein
MRMSTLPGGHYAETCATSCDGIAVGLPVNIPGPELGRLVLRKAGLMTEVELIAPNGVFGSQRLNRGNPGCTQVCSRLSRLDILQMWRKLLGEAVSKVRYHA